MRFILLLPVLLLAACVTPDENGENALQKLGREMQEANNPAYAKKTQEPFTRNNVVYDASECTGPVIMGECHGGIIPKSAHHPTCHGEMLNGQCTGPMF